MLGVTVPDIHRSLDKAVQATMIPAARVRGIYIDAARLEQYEQALVTAAIGATRRRLRRRFAFRSGRRRFPASTPFEAELARLWRTPQRLLRRDRAALICWLCCDPCALGRLRRENHRLRQERDILAKAAAWFARESKASPNGFTSS
jgi:hypothetical protein